MWSWSRHHTLRTTLHNDLQSRVLEQKHRALSSAPSSTGLSPNPRQGWLTAHRRGIQDENPTRHHVLWMSRPFNSEMHISGRIQIPASSRTVYKSTKILNSRISVLCDEQQPLTKMDAWWHVLPTKKSYINFLLPLLFRADSSELLRLCLPATVLSKSLNKT